MEQITQEQSSSTAGANRENTDTDVKTTSRLMPEYRVRDRRGLKKWRGKRAKKFHTVKITTITAEGFWLHNMGKDYYVKRINFPWFVDATDEEIHDVIRSKGLPVFGESKDSDDRFSWGLLDFDIKVRWFENPKILETLSMYMIAVRGVPRHDLFKHWANGIVIVDNTPPAKSK